MARKAQSLNPIEKLAFKIGQDTNISGRHTFVPLINADGERVIETIVANSHAETLGRIKELLAALPKDVVNQLMIKYRIRPTEVLA